LKIVVLDGYAANPGDLSWEALAALGELTVYDRTAPTEVRSRAEGAHLVLTNKTVLGRQELESLPDLRYIGVLATGYNVVEVAAARSRGIVVTNVPAYSTPSVVQLTFALLLELTHGVGHHAQTVRDGKWAASKDFCYWDHPLRELAGLTLGLLGYGRIGSSVAAVGRALGMEVAVSTRNTPLAPVDGIRFVGLDALFAQSDVLSLHCPLTPETEGLVNADRLRSMRPTAFLLNTSRGPVVDEAALADALNSDRLAGAGVDVLSTEPPLPDNPLLTAKNCFITPHVGWATRAARARLMTIAAENVEAFLAGNPQNLV
jgi:glycerate dehydrogenase